ncbi:MAG: phosphatase PAP2 family protein [Candidatus Aquicultor sp.]
MRSSLRTFVFGFVFILLALFTVLSIYVYNHPANVFDLNATNIFQEQKWAGFLVTTNAIFKASAFRLVYVVLIGIFVLKKRYALSALVMVALASELLTYAIKAIIARPRPTSALVTLYDHNTGFSYVSGHTLEYTLLFGLLGFLALLSAEGRSGRYILSAVAFTMPLIVGLGRAYSGAHWLTDVIGGYLLGTALLLTLVYLCRGAFKPKRRFK